MSLGAPASHAFVAAHASPQRTDFYPRASPTAPYFFALAILTQRVAPRPQALRSSIKKKAMAEPTLAEKVSVLQRQLNLPEGANLVDKVENALEKIGLADELRGQPLTRKVDAALQTLGVTPQTSVPMGTPVSNAPVTAPLPTVVEARVVQEAEEQARREAEQARERALRHEAALEKALRDAMPGWFAVWTDRKHAALETAIAHAEAATPPEGSTLFAALNEAKEAARRGRGELDAKREAEEKARREAEEKARAVERSAREAAEARDAAKARREAEERKAKELMHKFIFTIRGERLGICLGADGDPVHDAQGRRDGGVDEYGRPSQLVVCSPTAATIMFHSMESKLLINHQRHRCINVDWWKLEEGTSCHVYDAYPQGPATGQKWIINDDGSISPTDARHLVLGLDAIWRKESN